MTNPFACSVTPNWQALVDTILRKSTPSRVHFMELYLDKEVADAIGDRFGLFDGLSPEDPAYVGKRDIAIQSFLGYDYVTCGLEGVDYPLNWHAADDTAELGRESGRLYMDEHKGPITNWEEFEAYPWPDPNKATSHRLEWYEANLPENMCVIGRDGFGSHAEHLSWLMGYETLCMALFEQRDLVEAIRDRLSEIDRVVVKRILEFGRVKVMWGSDDMGFKGGTMLSPADMREFVLGAHKEAAALSHAAGRPYILHSCGNLALIMDDLIDDVKIDGKHSYEDTIEQVTDVKETYGQRIALLGGIDMDFMCRATDDQVRARVRKTLDKCMPGGGYCLGTGNTVANYVPLENYLAMLDEGRRY
mgnify:CR=1 FL=1